MVVVAMVAVVLAVRPLDALLRSVHCAYSHLLVECVARGAGSVTSDQQRTNFLCTPT